jgi:hypothetical protein
MSYVILWALLNIHNGDMDGPYPTRPYHSYTAQDCVQALLNKGIQKPDKDGKVKVYECVSEASIMNRPTIQFTDL